MQFSPKINKYRFNYAIEQEIRRLFKLNNWRGVLALFADYFMIIFAIFISKECIYLYPISIFVIGSRQRAFATLMHESVHGTLAKNKTLNYILGSFFSGFLIFQSYSKYKKSHIRKHHAFLGDSVNDPDYNYHLSLGIYKNSQKKKIDLRFQKLNIFKKIATYPLYLISQRVNIFTASDSQAIFAIAYILTILTCIFTLGCFKLFVLYWLIPLFTSFIVIGFFIELAEHYPMVHGGNLDIQMSRNRFSHGLEAFFLGIHNENFHLIHHLRPGIPFWNMKRAHTVFSILLANLFEQQNGIHQK